MNSRQRFHETMMLGNPDRVPLLEEGIRKEVLESWHEQGLPINSELSQLFKFDPSSEIDLNLDIFSIYKKPLVSNQAITYLRSIFNHQKLNDLAEKLLEKLKAAKMREHIIFLKVHPGFFLSMGVHDWNRFTDVILLLVEKPEFVYNLLLFQSELISEILDMILPLIEIDAVIFSEPIGGNEGPLISSQMYKNMGINSHKPMLDLIKSCGVNTRVMRTYANTRILLPSIVNCGFNCLWACETNSEQMNYQDIRKEFGCDLRLIGGIDLDTLRNNKVKIREEIENNVPPLIADGGFIPFADGRVRPDITYEHYLFYRKLLEEITCD